MAPTGFGDGFDTPIPAPALVPAPVPTSGSRSPPDPPPGGYPRRLGAGYRRRERGGDLLRTKLARHAWKEAAWVTARAGRRTRGRRRLGRQQRLAVLDIGGEEDGRGRGGDDSRLLAPIPVEGKQRTATQSEGRAQLSSGRPLTAALGGGREGER